MKPSPLLAQLGLPGRLGKPGPVWRQDAVDLLGIVRQGGVEMADRLVGMAVLLSFVARFGDDEAIEDRHPGDVLDDRPAHTSVGAEAEIAVHPA